MAETSNPRNGFIRILAIAGLAAAAFAGFSADRPAELPGVALGWDVLLAVERTLALFAAWLTLAVILHNAWRGRLPVEISGRGLRYADAGTVQSSVDGIRSALGNHDREIIEMRRDIAESKHRRDGVRNS